MSKYIAESGDHYILLNGDISNHQKLISELKIDILIYADWVWILKVIYVH